MFLIQAKQQAVECKYINGGFKKDPEKGQIKIQFKKYHLVQKLKTKKKQYSHRELYCFS